MSILWSTYVIISMKIKYLTSHNSKTTLPIPTTPSVVPILKPSSTKNVKFLLNLTTASTKEDSFKQ
jgi:hypothetical protein